MSATATIPVANFYQKCFTCLSVGRRLEPLQEVVILDTLCPQIKLDPLESGTFYFICWECNATLKKIKKFQAKVLIAHDNLIRLKTDAPSLSRLSMTKGPIITIPPPANTSSMTQITNTEPTPNKIPMLAPITSSTTGPTLEVGPITNSTTGPTLEVGPITTSTSVPTQICVSTSKPIAESKTSQVFFPTTIIATSKSASNTTIEKTTSSETTIDLLITEIKDENVDVDENTMVIEPTTIQQVGNDSNSRDTASETKTDQSDKSETINKNTKEKEEKYYFVPIKLMKIEPNEPEPSVSNDLLVERTSETLPKIDSKLKDSKTLNTSFKLRDLHQAAKVTADSDKASIPKKPIITINNGKIEKPQDETLNNIQTSLNNTSNLKGSNASGKQEASVGDLVSNLITNLVSNTSYRQVPDVVQPATKIDDTEIEFVKQVAMFGFKEDEIRCSRFTQEEMETYREAKLNHRFFKNSEYKCTKCLVWYKWKEDLDVHIKLHDVKAGDHVCNICEQRFFTLESLTAHNNEHYMVFECMVCKWRSKNRWKITAHYRQKHRVDRFVCKKCKISFDTFEERSQHIKEVHPMKLSCPVCSKQTSSKFNLRKHLETHDNERTQCEVCNKYVRKASLQRHITTSHKRTDVKYHCEECNRTYTSKKAYKKHMKISLKHNSLEDIGSQCDHCKKIFLDKTSLAIHLRLHQGPLPREECPICQKMVRVIYLKFHMKQHQRKFEEKYVCEDCNKTFSHLATYQAHLKYSSAHATFKFPCSMCNKGYPTKEAMQDHFNYQHLGKTVHKCPVCEKPLSTRANVEKHLMRVHGQKKKKPRNHVCQFCGKVFAGKYTLIAHEETHSGERPQLSCDICEKTFARKASLDKHRLKVHKVLPAKRLVEYIDVKH